MNYENIGRYCVWADEKIITLLSKLSEENFSKKPYKNLRSLRELCEHLITSYELFFHELSAELYKKLLLNVRNLDKSGLLRYWKKTVEKFSNEIKSKTAEEITVTVDQNKFLKLARSDNIFSYIQHNSYHYGQLILSYRIITGKNGINLDYGAFLMEIS